MRKVYINGEPLFKRDRIESEVAQLKPGSIQWRKVVKITGLLLFVTTNPVWATGGIAAIGAKAYDILLDISFWYAIIGCALDLLKCGLNGTTNNVGKIVLSYAMMFASVAMLPWLITTIKGVLLNG